MKIYGIPLTGSIFVQVASPDKALEAAKDWAAVPLPSNLEVVLLKPQNDRIVATTQVVANLGTEAEKAAAEAEYA